MMGVLSRLGEDTEDLFGGLCLCQPLMMNHLHSLVPLKSLLCCGIHSCEGESLEEWRIRLKFVCGIEFYIIAHTTIYA